MDRNLLLAFALSMGVYIGWAAFVERQYPQQPPAVSQTAQPDASKPAPAEKTASAPAQTPPRAGRQTELSGRDWKAKIDSRGAAVSSFQYKGPLGWVELILTPERGFFATWPELDYHESREKDGVVFTARHPAGFKIAKRIQFAPSGQLGKITMELTNTGKTAATVPAWTTEIGPGLGTVPSEVDENPSVWRSVALIPAGDKNKLRVLKGDAVEAKWKWIGIDNRYFLAAVVGQPEEFAGASLKHESMTVQQKGWFHFITKETSPTQVQAPRLVLEGKLRVIPSNGELKAEIPFYLGPKEYIGLQKLDVGLERAVDFGWFDSIGRFTLKSLQWLHGLTGNYGWAIVILTLVLQLVMFPLSYKALKAANAMKKLQPEIARLQQKYQSDPKRLNMEMMSLYKAKGVNPLGGCLPMLLQLPIFVALFNALRNAWELHGASWIFWMNDLSSKDPYYILPVLMGGVMFLQNKTNPAMTSDPMQANMMTWMPVLFTFMFMNFPAGLVLYWLTNSLMSFAQQVAMRRYMD